MKKKRDLKSDASSNNWGYPWSALVTYPLQYKTISTDGIHYNEKDS